MSNSMSKPACVSSLLDRRRFCKQAAGAMLATGAASSPLVWSQKSFAVIRRDGQRPAATHGVASGDVTQGSAVVWSRADRSAQMIIEVATNESFRDARRIRGPAVLDSSDFTGKLRLTGLPPGERVFYRVTFEDLAEPGSLSPPAVGSFRTPSVEPRDVKFTFSGDTAGQGFGINPDFGGMKIYEAMRSLEPDFFIHSGDYVYADNPISPEIRFSDGSVWKNVTTEETSKVAETLAEFRGRYKYNLLDDNVRRFHAEVPQLVQWDDHETRNNWYPGQMLDDPRYTVKSCSLLAARGRRALLEYTPIGEALSRPDRIYRAISYGPLVEVFLLDARTYRGPNTTNRQPEPSEETAFLGAEQIAWLKRRLRRSRALWKVIACDMPLGLIVGDSGGTFEAVANADDGPPLGRELEIADLLRFIKRRQIRNTVWFTADVHYAAAHYYDPADAQFPDFDGFWEFVAGPLNAGTFGPGRFDKTFGPRAEFIGIPADMRPNRPPSEGLQFFGSVRVAADSQVMTVALHDLTGRVLYDVEIPPQA